MLLPDFPLTSAGPVSLAFAERSIHSFREAAVYVKNLPYGRNQDKNDPLCVLSDNRGTCSSKHALIRRLADENGETEVKLILGIFRMNGNNTPAVAKTLLKHGLDHIPEAHCYLSYRGQISDLTKAASGPSDFVETLLEETEINPEQISGFKENYHRNFLATWLSENRHMHCTLPDLWAIREQCIQDLAEN